MGQRLFLNENLSERLLPLLEHLQKQKPDQDWKALHGPTPELMVPLADQLGEIGLCVFTKGKRVGITLRGEPFPHLLAACGGVPKALRTARLDGDAVDVEAAKGWRWPVHSRDWPPLPGKMTPLHLNQLGA